ncbi:MAG: hypothetical protein JW705_07305 [Methanosarcinaceae archaeon]|nr:hypothetical protein [Methanosarcinaceae archaeon]
MTILVTEALADRIFFSLFVGIPAGILTFIATFVFLGLKKDMQNEKPDK